MPTKKLSAIYNLFGDTNVVSVRLTEGGTYEFVHEIEGDSIADVLSYVEYHPKEMQERFRRAAELAVREGRITAAERLKIMNAFFRQYARLHLLRKIALI